MAIETTVLKYDVGLFPFPRLIEGYLGTNRLDSIHEGSSHELLTREKDQSTEFHRTYYDRFGEDFELVYRRFLTEVVRPFFREDLVYQRIPTFRVQLPGNVAVGEFHRDRDYSHGEGEVNFWLPVTRAWGTNAVWIESAEGAEDFRPYPVEVGQVLVFDGVNLAHGNKENETGKTRVSFDFRVIPRSKYRPRTDTSVNTGVKFEIGGYFAELEPAEAGAGKNSAA
jgi:ectoine hydroxylase-related dioxygenase (phytanoyl-CoA dioxygenase family)